MVHNPSRTTSEVQLEFVDKRPELLHRPIPVELQRDPIVKVVRAGVVPRCLLAVTRVRSTQRGALRWITLSGEPPHAIPHEDRVAVLALQSRYADALRADRIL